MHGWPSAKRSTRGTRKIRVAGSMAGTMKNAAILDIVSVIAAEVPVTLGIILVIVIVIVASLVKDQEKEVIRVIVLTGATKRKNLFLTNLHG